MSYKVGTKGQVVIDQDIREALGIEAGWVATQRLVDDHVEIRFFPPEHNRSLFGVLAKYVKQPVNDEDWQAVKERAWAVAVAEKERAIADDARAAKTPPKKKG
jgi:bifunctional DNA-binding transcriptional regulator/antitoxin component of YhaV-PrlF toxin-antitoxin module